MATKAIVSMVIMYLLQCEFQYYRVPVLGSIIALLSVVITDLFVTSNKMS